MKVQVGNKVHNALDKPIVISLTKEDKKFLKELPEDKDLIVFSYLTDDEFEDWKKNNLLILPPKDEKTKINEK